MDSFPIPESDSLLAQVQANLDLQQEGLHSVLGSIGSSIADGLDTQAKNSKKCIRKLEKQIRDNLSFQNAKLQGVIDQLLTVVTTLIGEQGVSLAQIQGDIGLSPLDRRIDSASQFQQSTYHQTRRPDIGDQGANYATPQQQFPAGTLPQGSGNASSIAEQSRGSTPAVRPLEGSFPVLPDMLHGTMQQIQRPDGTAGPAYTRPFFPAISPPSNLAPQQKTVQNQKDIGVGIGQASGQIGQHIASLPTQVQSAISNALASINLTLQNAPPSILQPILDVVMSTYQAVSVQGQSTGTQLLPSPSDGKQRVSVCMEPCHSIDTLTVNAIADDISVGTYVNGDEEIQAEYEELEL